MYPLAARRQIGGLGIAGGLGDVIAPTVIITCTQTSPSSAATLNFTFTFSESVTGFVVSDITVANGSKSNFAGSGAVYTCDVTPDYLGEVTVDVAADVCEDGAGNGNEAADQFFMSVFKSSISPTVGASTTVDGDMEAAGVTAWTSSGTPTTKEKSTTQKHGGAQSLRVITDAGGEGAYQPHGGVSANQWCQWGGWGFVVSGDISILGSIGIIARKDIATLNTWTEISAGDLMTGANPRINARTNSVAASEYYFDDAYLYPLTLATCFANPKTGAAITNVGANVSAVDLQKVGVVANLDSITTPANYVLAVIDRYKAYLFQVSAGVYTAKINGTNITYAADKVLEIRHTAPTTYQLWYNGSQVGTDQTINDAAINNNTLYAQFSTYSGNAFTSFTW